jgi:single-stranded-DNA-specific exonuclease
MVYMLSRTIRRRESGVQALPGDLHPLLRRLYANRGVNEAGDLDLGLARLIPVSQLGGIDAAVDLLCEHFRRGTRIVVVGDFDADGATSTALVVRQLTGLGFKQVEFLVPNRFQYGYGLTPGIVQLAAQLQPGLIVTVDIIISPPSRCRQPRPSSIPIRPEKLFRAKRSRGSASRFI